MKKINKNIFVFPAIFESEQDGGYSVSFPDLEGCFSQGDDMTDALLMSKEALGAYLCSMIDRDLNIPSPSNPASLKAENGFISLIEVDILKFRTQYNDKLVKKTLNLPVWLNDLAVQKRINFSSTLQEALKEKLKVS